MNVHKINVDFDSVQPIKTDVMLKQFEYGNDRFEISLLKNGSAWNPGEEFSEAHIKLSIPDGSFSERVLWIKESEDKNKLLVNEESTVLLYDVDIFEVYKPGEVNLQIAFYSFDDEKKISKKTLSPIIYFDVFKSLSSFNLLNKKYIDLIDELINEVKALNVTVNYKEYVQSLMKALADIVNLDNNKVNKIDGKGLSSNDYTDEDKKCLEDLAANNVVNTNDISQNKEDILNLSNDLSVYKNEIHKGETSYNSKSDLAQSGKAVAEAIANYVKSHVYKVPITSIPLTLEVNSQYNFGEIENIHLTFPTTANDGDVIYLTFSSGEKATTLTIDTTNTCDIEIIPEVNTGYEIFGKYNGSIWIINYSEYTVSEG